MNRQIYLNLPVADLPKAAAFYQALGYALDPKFSGDDCACVIIGETIFVMLGTHAKFREFTPKAVCDTSVAVECLFNLRCDSRQQVDDLVAKAIAAGGSTYDKAEDFGFMYTHSFLDPDGHGWGLFHMTEGAAT